MTTTRQTRCPLPRRAIRALRRLNDELLAAGDAMARSARAHRPAAKLAFAAARRGERHRSAWPSR